VLKAFEAGSEEDRLKVLEPRIRNLTQVFTDLWVWQSSSMRLSIVEDLLDPNFAEAVEDFITAYGDELFHTRMLTLGNIRTILHHGVETLFAELAEASATQPYMLIDHLESGVISQDEAEDVTEFVLECLVDNFERFMEYNTTTTYSDYGSRLYCFLDFLRVELLYHRFEWLHAPWQLVHEVLCRHSETKVAEAVRDVLQMKTADEAQGIVNALLELEKKYGVKLPAMHDHINERIVGGMEQSAIAAMISKACQSEAGGGHSSEAAACFQSLRVRIANYMKTRSGSGIEAPVWMQRLGTELDQIQDREPGSLNSVLSEGEYMPLTRKDLDNQISKMRRR
jgi:hypothetical protein